MSHFWLPRKLAFLLLVLALAASAAAQNQNPQSAVDSLMRSNLHVDPSTGAMQLQIPLGEYRGRGEASLPITLNYSSKVWNMKYKDTLQCGVSPDVEPVSTYRPEYAQSSASGWTSTLGWFLPTPDLSLELYDGNTQQPSQQAASLFRIMRMYVTLPDGSRHELRRDDVVHGQGDPLSGVYFAVDGSRLQYNTADDTLLLPNGSRIVNYLLGRVEGHGPIQYVDRNGNRLTYDVNSGQWIDTMDRRFGAPVGGTAPGAGDQIYTMPGVNGTTLTYTMRWRNLGDALTDPTTQHLHYKGDAPNDNCTPGGFDGNNLFSSMDGQQKVEKGQIFNPVVLYQIVLPHDPANQNPPSYTFTYNVFGEIDKIVYPTGGIEQFTYTAWAPLGGQLDDGTYSQANRGVWGRTVSDGVNPPQQWSYDGNMFANGVDPATWARSFTAPDTTTTVTWYYKSRASEIKYGFDDARTGMAREERVYKGTTMLRRTLYQLAEDGPQQPGGHIKATRNARVVKQLNIIFETGADALAALTEMTYDSDLNVTSTKHYDYASISRATGETADIPAICGTTPNMCGNGTLLRTQETTFLVNDPTISPTMQADYRARNLVALPTATRVKNGAGDIVAQSSTHYDEAAYPLIPESLVTTWSDPDTTVRGNPTSSGVWLDTTGAYLETHAKYDQYGNVRIVRDAKGNESQVEYSDTYAYAFPTLNRSAVPDPDGTHGSSIAFVSTSVYDFKTGMVTSTTDANNQTTNFSYVDPQSGVAEPLNRIKRITRPDGGVTTYNYNDTPGSLSMQTLTKQDATRNIDSIQTFDALGRPSRSFLNVGGGNYNTSDTRYDLMGRIWRVSNPYLSSGPTSTPYLSGTWTTTTYDDLGRVKSVTTPDGSPVTTDYGLNSSSPRGTTVTVTDPALRTRRSLTDALGRLARVDEPPDPNTNGNLGSVGSPNQATSYSYDVLGNLHAVTQGSQQRFFAYDSLSRLLRARNPETAVNTNLPALTNPDLITGNSQWSLAYVYDENGNLKEKTDARGVVSKYDYDALNRNTTTTYEHDPATTPAVTRFYDGFPVDPLNPTLNAKGKQWRTETTGDSATRLTVASYDSLGRPLAQSQQFYSNNAWSASYTVQRSYDLAGHVASQIYPSGHTVTYNQDVAGRLGDKDTQNLAFAGNLGDGVARIYSRGISYSEFGGLRQEEFGTQTPLYHKLHYNIRGQLNDIRLSTVAWSGDQWNWNRGAIVNYYSATDVACQTYQCRFEGGPTNNGNLVQSQYWIPTDDAMSGYNWTEDRYEYDSLNRLQSVAEYHGTSAAGLGGQDFKQAYTYDRFGNRTIDQVQTSANVPHPNYTADPNSNRLIAPAGYNYHYDAAGNQDNDDYTGAGPRTYDAENRIATAAGTSPAVYSYDADGHRVKRNIGGVETCQIYGLDGELLAEYSSGAATFLPATEYGYRSGQLLVTINSGDTQRLGRFVTNLYYGALQRDPTPVELQDKVGQLAAAGAQGQAQLLATAKQVGRSLFTATNYETSPARSNLQYVADLYYAYLQRGPDTSGLNFWALTILPNSTRANVCSDFENSPEFQALVVTLYGSAVSDNDRTDHFINNFYLGAYGRNATATELQQQRDALNAAAAQGLAQVQAQAETMGRTLFAGQVNGVDRASDTQFVTNLYESFLQRGPDAGGLTHWVTDASVGLGRQDVLNNFATCGPFRELTGRLYREVNWLVADHLGTPRIVVNKLGSLSSVKRHDYLPFGEELFADTGGRTPAQGYTGDSVRHKFTSKERDNETGLDYFGARYYGNVQGRFTSADPLYIDLRRLKDPQQLNLYAYARNNPLAFTDPTGFDIKATNSQKDEYLKKLKGAVSFKIHLNKSDMVKIIGKGGQELSKKELEKLGKTLTGGDKEIFNAITDTKNHVIMDTGNGTPDTGVDFASQGSSSGNSANKTLDMTDINRLGSGTASVGLSSEQAVAHETLEAYSLAQGNSWSDAHAYAAGNFGALNYLGTDRGFGPEGGNMITLVKTEYSIQGQSNSSLIITKELVTPIPIQQFRNVYLPGNITDIQKKKP